MRERHDAWHGPTRGTRWTNEQLSFHMVFGYMIVHRLLILVKLFSRLPIESAASSHACSMPQQSPLTSSTTAAPARPHWSTSVEPFLPTDQ